MRKFFVVAAVIFSSPLLAQDSSSMDEVVITATKYPVKQSNTGKIVTVVNRQQIERSAGKDLAQVLNEQTGITVGGANSNPGKDKSIFLRGAGNSYTLILLDGIPLNDPSGVGGLFDIRLIPLEQIERIEILKGSQSTLYGANAIAGVINIISRKAVSNEITGTGLLSYGSYGTKKGNASFNRKGKILEYSLNYDYFDTKGISEAKEPAPNSNFDKDGFNRNAFIANLGFNVTDKIKLSPYFRYSKFRGEYDSDAFTDGSEQYNASLTNTGLIGTFGYQKGVATVNYGYDKTSRDFNGFPFFGKFHHAEGYINHTVSKSLQLLAGINFQSYHLPKPDTTNTIFSPYASLVFRQKGLSVELGGRYNKHSEYGDNFTYSFNPSYLLHDQVKIFGNLSTGFRAPSISELFGPFGANPNLKPEKSRNIEGGVQVFAKNKKASVLVSYFNRDIEDVIIYAFPGGYTNRDRQKDHGVEAEFAFQPDSRWNLKASYAFVDGEITQKLMNKDTTFNNLLRRPKHTANVFAGCQVTKHFFASASMQSFSKRKDIFFNPANFYAAESKELKAYSLLNVYTEYKLLQNGLVLFADVKNVLNKKDYTEVYGYAVQGINVNGGIRFKL